MNAGTISRRYAKAIFQYASEHGEETLLYEEMKTLSGQFLAAPLLKKVLDDPTVPASEKIKVLITAIGTKVSNAGEQVIRMVIKNGRGHYMQSIALMYEQVYRKEKNTVVIKLTTVEPASVEVKNNLVNLIVKEKDKQVDFITKTDNDLIGGFVLEIEDSRLDASMKNQLNQLRLELINN